MSSRTPQLPRGALGVNVLGVDPELGASLSEADRVEATRAAVAPVLRLDVGPWSPPRSAEPEHLGLLLIDGVLTRTVTAGSQGSTELLVSGDVLRPWVELGADSPSGVAAEWIVIETATLAVLNGRFGHRTSPWPGIACALMDRLVVRTERLALDLAISHVRRLDDRLMLLFWGLARRWGKVTPEGVVVPLNLQHQLLATLIGAQRPSVTTRLGVLRNQGRLVRREDGSWLLPDGIGPNVLQPLEPRAPVAAA